MDGTKDRLIKKSMPFGADYHTNLNIWKVVHLIQCGAVATHGLCASYFINRDQDTTPPVIMCRIMTYMWRSKEQSKFIWDQLMESTSVDHPPHAYIFQVLVKRTRAAHTQHATCVRDRPTWVCLCMHAHQSMDMGQALPCVRYQEGGPASRESREAAPDSSAATICSINRQRLLGFYLGFV